MSVLPILIACAAPLAALLIIHGAHTATRHADATRARRQAAYDRRQHLKRINASIRADITPTLRQLNAAAVACARIVDGLARAHDTKPQPTHRRD